MFVFEQGTVLMRTLILKMHERVKTKFHYCKIMVKLIVFENSMSLHKSSTLTLEVIAE